MKPNRIEGGKSWELLQVTNREMRYILKEAGYTITAFGTFLDRSHTFVGKLGPYGGFIPSLCARALSLFVKPEAFSLHLAQIRRADMEMEKQRQLRKTGGSHE